ncbi:MAG TPA: metal-dependent hydrolase [candidate division Zixibacteria bacterium]|nr:metal-dependent hydrolase [candidate division Zixibacteria bacterium]
MAKLTWYGHAAFLLESGQYKILFDPFLTGNPFAPVKPEQVQATHILVSHGHGDHLGDTIAIAKRTKATVIGPYELAGYCASKGCNVHEMHIGGGHNFPFGRIKLTIAHHGSDYEEDGNVLYLGNPCGYVVNVEGKNLYHSGDTALFMDMQLIGQMHPLEVALLPIGDNFTMGPEDALKAVEFLKPKTVVPMHYSTWDIIKQDPRAFASKVKGSKVVILEPGKSLEF